MKLGFIIPSFSNERRVALLPKHIKNFENEIFIEDNFGMNLDISNEEYEKVGCTILKRKEIFLECDAVFSLKVIKEEDYKYIRENQMIIGWTHPFGSGKDFMDQQGKPKSLIIVDLDNIHPSVFYKDIEKPINWIKPNFIRDNSYIAGYSAVIHAIINFGLIPDNNTRVAILGSGNVSQGAFNAIAKFTDNIRMFYRKTLNEFQDCLDEFDIIINGIELDFNKDNLHIITLEQQKKLKKHCLVIDAAANAGRAIEGSVNTCIDKPIYVKDNVNYYVVNNAPSIFYRTVSEKISKSFSENIYSKDVKIFRNLVTK
ncbi:Rossmann-fold NAD(P)-binding domain-containing protein [Clostridium brassicae]|uniref:N(5)-(Carboxyethyl)ornithine synthase n=1 Tax=Clostridium brassicae TaxID=2999072 RepID=A0ABT4DA01_9CLOT|nr:N(5)-(carboxyethyl)ornithine synthase [Clostridium brassicae]MCY6959129.1 N(5)-(carboxyethyl)ornithine synthase [Clostridium brassicae]